MSQTARLLAGAAPAAARETAEAASEAAKKAGAVLNGVSDALGLTPKVEKNPYAAVAVALGVGYLLGGGLVTPTTARLLQLTAKLSAIPPVRDRLLDVAESVIDGLLASPGPKER